MSAPLNTAAAIAALQWRDVDVRTIDQIDDAVVAVVCAWRDCSDRSARQVVNDLATDEGWPPFTEDELFHTLTLAKLTRR